MSGKEQARAPDGTAHYLETGRTIAETVLEKSGIARADWPVVRRYAETLAAYRRGLRPSGAMESAVERYESVGRDAMGDPRTPQEHRPKRRLSPFGRHVTTDHGEGQEDGWAARS